MLINYNTSAVSTGLWPSISRGFSVILHSPHFICWLFLLPLANVLDLWVGHQQDNSPAKIVHTVLFIVLSRLHAGWGIFQEKGAAVRSSITITTLAPMISQISGHRSQHELWEGFTAKRDALKVKEGFPYHIPTILESIYRRNLSCSRLFLKLFGCLFARQNQILNSVNSVTHLPPSIELPSK